MNTSLNFPSRVIDSITELRGRQKPPEEIKFPKGEVITPIGRIEVPFLERYLLRVPMQTCAVVYVPEGYPRVYSTGDHLLKWPMGTYPIQYVDIRQQHAKLPIVQAVTADTWTVWLEVGVIWRVRYPIMVIEVNDLIPTFISGCISAVKDFIQSLPHDQIICTPNETAIEVRVLEGLLLQRLNSKSTCKGLELIGLRVLGKQGDNRRTEAIQIEQDMLVQDAKTRYEIAVLAQQLELANRSEGVKVKEAEIERKRIEEAEKITLMRAKIHAQEAELLRARQQQEIEMKNLAERQYQAHEKYLEAIKVLGNVLGQYASTVGNAQMLPGVNRVVDDNAFRALEHSYQTLVHALTALQEPDQGRSSAQTLAAGTLFNPIDRNVGAGISD
ncbi:MAG: hypothetical protein AB1894_26305 [Chloroflexota bacterium]